MLGRGRYGRWGAGGETGREERQPRKHGGERIIEGKGEGDGDICRVLKVNGKQKERERRE